MRNLVILANVVMSSTLVVWGLRGMFLTNRGLGVEHEWSVFIWITGFCTFFFIPLEICVLKPRTRGQR